MSIPLRVLSIEDNRDDYELLVALLCDPRRRHPYAVDWASDFADGFDALMQSKYDVCIIDYSLGDRDGVDLVLKATEAGTNVPMIFLTGNGDAGIEKRALAVGAADYLVKGQIDTESLERAIRHSVERGRIAGMLREQQRQLRAVFDGTWEAMLIANDDGRYVDGNAAALELLGVTREQLLQMSVEDTAPVGADEAAVRGAWDRFLGEGTAEGEFLLRRRDGKEVVVEHRGTARIMKGRHLSVFRDISEKKVLEAQLAVSERMASMGTLAAGIAHEINNPLAALSANLELMSEQLGVRSTDSDERSQRGFLGDVHEVIAEARSSAETIRRIVKGLKVFSRSAEGARGPVELHHVIDSTVRMAGNEIRHRAQLVKDYGSVPPVHGNETELAQVFLNLVVNAAQSIPAGSARANEIRISTRSLDDGKVAIEIRDTGVGIPQAVLPHVFDPFFTTKPAGVGTGLGLSICRRIVDDLGGTISVQSSPGRGTVFRVVLAASTAEAVEMNAVQNVDRPISHRGSVLVLDDEPSVANVVRHILTPPHDVTVFTTASDALQALRGGVRFDVIICDMMMPEMTGADFYEALRAVAPGDADHVLFLTGGAFTDAAREFLERVPNERIEKPFSAVELRASVARRVAALRDINPPH